MNTDEQKRHFMVSATAVMLYEIIFDFYCLSSHMYCHTVTFFICLFTLITEGKAKVHLKDSMKIKMYSFSSFTFLESVNSTHGPDLKLLN